MVCLKTVFYILLLFPTLDRDAMVSKFHIIIIMTEIISLNSIIEVFVKCADNV